MTIYKVRLYSGLCFFLIFFTGTVMLYADGELFELGDILASGFILAFTFDYVLTSLALVRLTGERQ